MLLKQTPLMPSQREPADPLRGGRLEITLSAYGVTYDRPSWWRSVLSTIATRLWDASGAQVAMYLTVRRRLVGGPFILEQIQRHLIHQGESADLDAIVHIHLNQRDADQPATASSLCN